MNGGTFISPVMIQNAIGQNDQKVTRGPPVIDSKLIPPFDPHTGTYSKYTHKNQFDPLLFAFHHLIVNQKCWINYKLF